MGRLLFPLALTLAVIPLSAQEAGLISGTVIDGQSREPIPGARVVVEGTHLQAITDTSGSFLISGVIPGEYVVLAWSPGYDSLRVPHLVVKSGTVSRVDAGLTYGQPLPLGDGGVEDPLVRRDATDMIRRLTSEDILRIPARSYLDVAAMQPGATRVGRMVLVRGGRVDEVAFLVDGMFVGDSHAGAGSGMVVNESLEHVAYQAGGFGAGHGFGNSGLVSATTKTGGDDYSATVGLITDHFLPLKAPPADPVERIREGRRGPQSLMSYGHLTLHASLGGPVPGTNNALRFHVASEVVDNLDGTPSAGRNYHLPANKSRQFLVNSNLSFELQPFEMRVGGFSFTLNDRIHSTYHSVFNEERMLKRRGSTHAYYARISHVLAEDTYYSAMVNWFRTETEVGDPIWWDDVDSYGDPAKNPILPSSGRNPPAVFHNLFAGTGYVNFRYDYNSSSYVAGKLDVSGTIGVHSLNIGGEYRYNTLRSWTTNLSYLSMYRTSNPSASREVSLRNSYTSNLGMTVTGVSKGNKTTLDDGGTDPNSAPHPIIASAYIQDTFNFEDVALNLGVRLDYLDANSKQFKDPLNIVVGSNPAGYVELPPENFVDVDDQFTFSPRIGISLLVSPRWLVHGHYGHFVQQPELRLLYTSTTLLAQQLLSGTYALVGNPGLKSPRTVAAEVGVACEIGDDAGIDVTAFFKETTDLIGIENQLARPVQYALFVNRPEVTVQGISMSAELRRTKRFSARANYTRQYATGDILSASNDPGATTFGSSGGPVYLPWIDYDQRHSGSLNVDFRTLPDDGPLVGGQRILSDMGVNMLFMFRSGWSYTHAIPRSVLFGSNWQQYVEGTKSTLPWHFQFDVKIDKIVRIGAVNVNIFLWVINLLNAENIVFVYPLSGLPYDDGFFTTASGQMYAEREGAEAVDGYRYRLSNPDHWETPRQLRLGIRVEM